MLYERSAIWRAIVHVTKDPKVMAMFAIGTTGAFTAVAWGLQALTDRQSEKASEEIRAKLKKDGESRRYADHSKRALDEVLSAAVGNEPAPQKYPMKVPGVHWHPAAEARAKLKEETATKVSPPSDKTA